MSGYLFHVPFCHSQLVMTAQAPERGAGGGTFLLLCKSRKFRENYGQDMVAHSLSKLALALKLSRDKKCFVKLLPARASHLLQRNLLLQEENRFEASLNYLAA